MGIIDFFKRPRARAEPNIPTGRISGDGNSYYNILSPFRSRTNDILRDLRMIPDEAEAIDYTSKKVPDMSMSLWNFQRLSNQGHKMAFYDLKGNRIKVLEEEWRGFASRVNAISNAGLDGLIDIFHKNAFLRGCQMCEVEVGEGLTDIVDVYPIDPQTVTWEKETRDGKKVWVPYQQDFTRKIDLSKGNFFYVPTDPDNEDPRGNLIMGASLQPIDYQLQSLQDMAAVLRRQGYPRADISISRESYINSLPANIRNNPRELSNALDEYYHYLKSVMRELEPTDDYIHYDDTTINQGGSTNPARSMDIRAFNEMTDTQVMSGLKQLSVFANRNTGVTETWGTVQFRIYCSGIASIQRGSKRLIEEIAKLWLRIKGVQATAVFEHNAIDWNSEEQRMNVNLMKQDFYAIAQLMGWINADMAASEVMDVERAVSQEPTVEAKIHFSTGGEKSIADNEKHKRVELPEEL